MNKQFILTLLISVCLLVACNNNKPQNNDKEEPKAEVAFNESDLIPLNQFPTSDDHLTVVVSPDFLEAVISLDGKEIQTISDEDGLISMGEEVAPVHFLDANFDGHTDIFIGVGESRTYSTLLLWNAEEQQFHRVGTLGSPDLQGFKLCPTEKKVIEGGSGSYCSFYITQSHWNGDELVRDEQLVIISDPGEYIPYGVKNKYTIQDGNEKELCSVENKESLPEFWQAVINSYDME